MSEALFNTEEATTEQQAEINRLAAIGAEMRRNEEVAFDVDLDVASAQHLAVELVSTKDANEAHLSFALWSLKDNSAWLEAGYSDFNEYVEGKLKFSGSKGNAMSSKWGHFIDMGLAANVLTGPNAISWSKFGSLLPGIKSGVIDDSNIDVWLPYIVADGPESQTVTAIEKMVRALVNQGNVEDNPDKLTTFSIKLTADDREHIQRYVDTIGEATGQITTSDVIRTALESKITEIAEDSEDVRANYGVTRLLDIAQRMAPDTQIVCLASPDSGVTEQSIGVMPYTHVYQAQDNVERFTLALSPEAAVEALGGPVNQYPLTVAETVNNTATYSQEADSAPEVEENCEEAGEFVPNEVPDFEQLDDPQVRALVKSYAGQLVGAQVLTVEEFSAEQTKINSYGTIPADERMQMLCSFLINLSNDTSVPLN